MKGASLATVLLFTVAACSHKGQPTSDAPAAPASSVAANVVADAGAPEPPRELSPKEKLEAHRAKLTELASQGKYSKVCKGAPWFNQVPCSWVAARASEKAAERPDSELFRAFFTKERWKRVYGTLVTDPNKGDDSLEASVGGYRSHVVLRTVDTKFSSRGRFDMWVQEQPDTEEVTLNSSATANWVVLEEAPLARVMFALGKSRGGGIEGIAMAKDAMAMIATYQTYAELKGVPPALPDAKAALAPQPAQTYPTAEVVAATAPASTKAPAPIATPTPTPAIPVVAAMPKPQSARGHCVATCVSKCADDTACERTCVAACPSP